MGMTLGGDWNKVNAMFGSSGKSRATIKAAKTLAMKRTLAFFELKIKQNIVSSGTLAGKPFRENADLTKLIKKSTKPLIDTGQMMGSVHAVPINENFGFVGLKRGTVHKKSEEDLADIAEIHEFGAIVKNHEIKPRPFVGPVLKKFKKEAGEVYLKAVEEVLNG